MTPRLTKEQMAELGEIISREPPLTEQPLGVPVHEVTRLQAAALQLLVELKWTRLDLAVAKRDLLNGKEGG